MYFRSRKKLQGEVSLSDSIETDQDGNDLMLMDVVGVDDTMLSDLQDREDTCSSKSPSSLTTSIKESAAPSVPVSI